MDPIEKNKVLYPKTGVNKRLGTAAATDAIFMLEKLLR